MGSYTVQALVYRQVRHFIKQAPINTRLAWGNVNKEIFIQTKQQLDSLIIEPRISWSIPDIRSLLP